MRNTELQRVADIFVGDWTVTITNQRWLDDKTATTAGVAKGEWLGDAFVQLRMWFEAVGNELFGATAVDQPDELAQPQMHFVFGRSDAREQFVALSHDERGVLRIFDLALNGDTWELHRSDPDFHQRFVGRVDGNRILAHPDISEDQGKTWITDFDMTLRRV